MFLSVGSEEQRNKVVQREAGRDRCWVSGVATGPGSSIFQRPTPGLSTDIFVSFKIYVHLFKLGLVVLQ